MAEPTFMVAEYKRIRFKLSLDLMAIDEALEEMPILIQDTGEIVAEAIELREAAKEDLSRIQAEAAERLRSNSNGKAPSETTVQSKIPLDQDYQTALTSLSTARLDAALWSSLMEALRKKDSSIRTAADLLNSGFLTTDYIRSKRRKEIRNVKVVKE